MKLHEAMKLRDELEVAYINGSYRNANGFNGKYGLVSFEMKITSEYSYILQITFFGDENNNLSLWLYDFSEKDKVAKFKKRSEDLISGKLLFEDARKDC